MDGRPVFVLIISDFPFVYRKIPFRLYVPHTERYKTDAIVWVHGGGFVLGSITGKKQSESWVLICVNRISD
jgi:acetyl esterase/lipase